MSRTSDIVGELKPSGIREFFDMVMGMDDVISLGVGEPDFTTPMHIRQNAIKSIEDGFTNYTSNKGLPELRETIAEHIHDEHGLEYSPESEILITTGVSEAMDLAMRAIINPDDEVLIPLPCYISYVPTARMAGADVTHLHTDDDSDFKVPPEQLDSKITEQTKALTINYPKNPTGMTYSESHLEKLAEVIQEKDMLVVSDEIYGKLTFESNHVPFPTLSGMKDKTILLDGFSKSHAMTGFRIGFAAGPEDVISTMTKIHQYTMLCAPTTSQFAAIDALVNGDRSVRSMRDEYQSRRDLVVHKFRKMGLSCVEPEGTFYAFPSIEATGISAKRFCENLLKEKKVATVPGTAFGPGYENYIRVSFATDREQLKEALDRIEQFVDDLELAQTSDSSSPTKTETR